MEREKEEGHAVDSGRESLAFYHKHRQGQRFTIKVPQPDQEAEKGARRRDPSINDAEYSCFFGPRPVQPLGLSGEKADRTRDRPNFWREGPLHFPTPPRGGGLP